MLKSVKRSRMFDISPVLASADALRMSLRRQTSDSLIVLSAAVLALILMMFVSHPPFRTISASSLVSAERFCPSARVATGDFVMSAFGEASVRAMSKGLANHGLQTAQQCGRRALKLEYSMTFDAQRLAWQAVLIARNAGGEVVWQASEAAGIVEEGAFQYTTEHTAEILLMRFLVARAAQQ